MRRSAESRKIPQRWSMVFFSEFSSLLSFSLIYPKLYLAKNPFLSGKISTFSLNTEIPKLPFFVECVSSNKSKKTNRISLKTNK